MLNLVRLMRSERKEFSRVRHTSTNPLTCSFYFLEIAMLKLLDLKHYKLS